MKRNTLKDRLRYRMDLIMSRGTSSLIFFLSVITLFLVILAGIAVIFVERAWANDSFPFAVWKSFTLTLDPGNLASVEGSIGLILIAALSTVGGIFITSTLISILSTGLSTRLENLQRGNAKIIEKNHIVILGYSESVFAIIKELQIAYDNQRSSCIVLLGNEDKQVMEEQVSRHIPFSKSTRIICRNGDITSAVDLERCSVETSKSIIINLSQDYEVIRTILALATYLNRETVRNQYPESHKIHISASINEQKNLKVARIAGQGFAEILHFKLIISRIIAHVCYQPGLSTVYTELFNFTGNEIYIESFPNTEGMTFHDVELSFPSSIVMGISRESTCILNPDPAMKLERDDSLILIAADDNVSKPTEIPKIELNSHHKPDKYRMTEPENLLILGNSNLLKDIMTELDEFLPERSKVIVAGKSCTGISHEQLAAIAFKNLEVECFTQDITDRTNLEKLMNRGIVHILILSDNALPPEQADAKTLSVLLQIRDLEKTFDRQFSITTEMIDIRNQELAEVTNVNDFVISNNITGLIMTQVAENRKLAPIFTELLDSVGSEVYLKPAENYVVLGQPVDMYTLTHLVSTRREVFLGYKVTSKGTDKKTVDIVLNPVKTTTITFTSDDWLIVLAED